MEDCASGSPPPKGKRQRVEPEHEDTVTNPFDDFSLPDDVLASIPQVRKDTKNDVVRSRRAVRWTLRWFSTT